MIPGHDILAGTKRGVSTAPSTRSSCPTTPASSPDTTKSPSTRRTNSTSSKTCCAPSPASATTARRNCSTPKTSPRASLVYTPNDRLVVRGGYSTAFRFPTFSELYQDELFPHRLHGHRHPAVSALDLQAESESETRGDQHVGPRRRVPDFADGFDEGRSLPLARPRLHRRSCSTSTPLPNPSSLGWENQPADARITGGEARAAIEFRAARDGIRELVASVGVADGIGRRFERHAVRVRLLAEGQDQPRRIRRSGQRRARRDRSRLARHATTRRATGSRSAPASPTSPRIRCRRTRSSTRASATTSRTRACAPRSSATTC